jgi:AcrR family transcriptional regulator
MGEAATVGTRQSAKEARRQRIIDAAEQLIEETASTTFSMQDLAQQAGFSTYTTYNLIGSKATVFYILLNRCVDRVDISRLLARDTGDAVAYVHRAGDVSVDVFVSRPNLYQPLIRHLFGVPDAVHRPAFMARSFVYWRAAVEPLIQAGYLGGAIAPDGFARDLFVFFTGSLEFWVHGELSADEFRTQVHHGLSLRLLALAPAGARQRLIDDLMLASPTIEAIVRRDGR